MWKEGSKRTQGSKRGGSRSQSKGLAKRDASRNGPSNTQQKKDKPKRDSSKKPVSADKPSKGLERNELSVGIPILENFKLVAAAESHPLLKVTETQVLFDRNLVLKDISVRNKGAAEDKAYAGVKGIHVNIRRGNTYLAKKDAKTTVCVRRGLRKFFDLYPEYIEHNLGTLATLDCKIGVHEANENKSIHLKIFAAAKELYDSQAGTVTIIEANKANGENCQISWVADVGAWAISSKNVCTLLRSIDDLAHYVGDRFHYAELIAREWFSWLKKQKDDKVEALKECLKDHTAVGEYVGNQNYQHLVRYSKCTLMFYSLVPKFGNDEAVNPKEAFEKLKQLGLQVVTFKEHAGSKTFAEFNNKLKELYQEVKESGIETREEGVVLYLVRKYNNGKEDLLSLCKLKTLEYQILRKLREKLNNFVEKTTQPRSHYETLFQTQTTELVGTSKLPQELTWYFDLAKLAFDFVEGNKDYSHLALGKYVSFLCTLIYCKTNQVPVSLGFFDKKVQAELYASPWAKYAELSKKLKIEEGFAPKEPRTIIFVPLTTPGMGKSFFYREAVKPFCDENNIIVRYVSSDSIRKSEMETLKKKEPTLTESNLFVKTRDAADQAFARLLMHYLKERTFEDKVIYIDKNHPPNAVRKVVEFVHQHKTKHADIRMVALTPRTKQGASFKIGEKEVTYPFSLDLALSCLSTVQTRSNHETLNGNGSDSAAILLMFYNMFRDFKFDAAYLKELGFNGLCAVDFYTENFNFSKEAHDKLIEILSKTKGGDKPKDIVLIDQLLGCIQDQLLQSQNNRPGKEVQVRNISSVIKNLPLDRPAPPPSILTKLTANSAKNGESAAKTQPASGAAAAKPAIPFDKYWSETVKDQSARLKAIQAVTAPTAIGKKEYKPAKPPTYLGVFVKNDETPMVTNLLKYVIAKVSQTTTDGIIQEDLQEFVSDALTTWKWPADGFHVTTCYVKGSKDAQNTPAYKQFEAGLPLPLKFRHVVYVPGKLATAIVYLDPAQVHCNNKFPHITLATKAWEGKHSNDVLEALFGGVFFSRYKDGLRFGADKTSTLNIVVGGEACTAYLFELPAELHLEAQTNAVGVSKAAN